MTLPEFIDKQIRFSLRSLKYARSKENVSDEEIYAIKEKIMHYYAIKKIVEEHNDKAGS